MSIPKVSVIIPNYNHAKYLSDRIKSVLHQSFRDLEVILLDDCSSDGSRDIIEKYAAKDARIRTYFSSTNSGSPFKQWHKGIQLAKGHLLWIAESDDYADKEFLATLVPIILENDKIALAFCQSYRIDSEGNILFSCINWGADRYRADFMNNGRNEFRKHGVYSHGIYNASAVLFKRSLALKVPFYYQQFRYAGDSLFWNEILWRGDIYFSSRCLNYFRESDNVGSPDLNKIRKTIIEEYRILSYFLSQNMINRNNRAFRKKLRILAGIWSKIFFHCNIRKNFDIYQSSQSPDKAILAKILPFAILQFTKDLSRRIKRNGIERY